MPAQRNCLVEAVRVLATSILPGRERGRYERQRDAAEDGPAPRAEAAGGVLKTGIHRAQPGLKRDHEERHGDESLRHDDARQGERQRHAERPVQRLTDQPLAAVGEQQGDAPDDGRQHHRQRGQAAQQGLAAELPARQQPGQRVPWASAAGAEFGASLSCTTGSSAVTFWLAGVGTPAILFPPALTSVVLVMPASASPSDTFVTTELTLVSSLTGCTVTRAFLSTCP